MSIDKFKDKDFRLQAITTLSKDWTSPWNGVLHTAGSEVMAIAQVRLGGNPLSFGLPNMTGMFIDFAYTLWIESELFLKDKEKFILSKSKYVDPNTMHPASDGQFFDLLEKRMGAIVFSYCALESFANENIPDEYIFTNERGDIRCTEKYSKEQIERHLNLDIKLGKILPEILKVQGPRGTKIWSKYKLIQDLRDRIIHIKSHDRRSALLSEKTIWSDLLNTDYINFALIAKDVIAYFLANTPEENKPRWFINFPYK